MYTSDSSIAGIRQLTSAIHSRYFSYTIWYHKLKNKEIIGYYLYFTIQSTVGLGTIYYIPGEKNWSRVFLFKLSYNNLKNAAGFESSREIKSHCKNSFSISRGYVRLKKHRYESKINRLKPDIQPSYGPKHRYQDTDWTTDLSAKQLNQEYFVSSYFSIGLCANLYFATLKKGYLKVTMISKFRKLLLF